MVTVGAFQSGTVGNIIPDEAIVRGTIRSYKPEVREGLLAGVRRTAGAVADMAGAPEPEVRIEAGGKAVNNDAQLVSRTEAVLRGAYGKNVMHVPPITASEDFSDFVNAGVPSMFFFVGVYDLQRYLDSRKRCGAAAVEPFALLRPGAGAVDQDRRRRHELTVMNALTLPRPTDGIRPARFGSGHAGACGCLRHGHGRGRCWRSGAGGGRRRSPPHKVWWKNPGR